MKKFLLGALLLLSAITFSQSLNEITLERKAKTESSNFEKRYSKNDVDYELHDVIDGKPIYLQTFNVVAAKSTRTNFVNTLGYRGEGQTLYIWDSGRVLLSHQEFEGRALVGDESTPTNHATHVAGTMIGAGIISEARGMSSKANIVTYNWTNDVLEASTAAQNGMFISNHSYGYVSTNIPLTSFGAYQNRAREWDLVLHNNPYYLQVVAAGNDGMFVGNTSPIDPTKPNYDKLTGMATAKNNLVIAAAEDANVSSDGNLISVLISNFSSQGPTDDLRIKPDLAGNGRGLYSASSSSNTSYTSLSGTSMASPNVSGSLALLQQYSQTNFGFPLRASSIKGLALHTADDAGLVGPDGNFGWGLLNTKKAVEVLQNKNNLSKIDELVLNNGTTYSTTVTSDGFSDLKVSISWTDPAGTTKTLLNDPTPVLVNDLDIRVTKGSVTYFPWVLTGVDTNTKADNNKDPFERVDIPNASGEYVITVSHKGVLINPQHYTLIVTGISQGDVICSVATPTFFQIPSTTSTTASSAWSFNPGGSYEIRYKKITDTTWISQPVSNTNYIINNLTPDTDYEAQVRGVCNGIYSEYTPVVTFKTKKECSSNPPTGTAVTNITSVSAKVTWQGEQNSTFQVRFKPLNSTTYTTFSLTSNSITISNLVSNTTYQLNVRNICQNGVASDWSSEVQFTTLEGCTAVPPTSCTFSNITTTSVTATWNPVALATSYGIRWRPLNATSWSVSSSTSTSRNIINLLPDTNYEVLLTSSCETGTISQYSQPFYFKTLSDGVVVPCTPGIPSNGTTSSITTNSASISWIGTAEQWVVSYNDIILTTTSNSTNLTNLQPSTTYNVEVRGKCIESGLVSSPITITFTTNEIGCVATTPTGVSFSDFTSTSFKASWNEVTLATYQVRISKQQGQSNWITYNVNTPSFTFNGLQPNTKYRVQISSVCSTSQSSWTNNNNVTTLRNNQSSLSIVEDDKVFISESYIITNFEYKEIRVFNIIGQLISKTSYVPTKGVIIVKIDDKTFKLLN